MRRQEIFRFFPASQMRLQMARWRFLTYELIAIIQWYTGIPLFNQNLHGRAFVENLRPTVFLFESVWCGVQNSKKLNGYSKKDKIFWGMAIIRIAIQRFLVFMYLILF